MTLPLRDVIARFDGLRVLVVGDPILDEYVTGDCTRLSPEAPIPVLRVRSSRVVLGGAANTAANVAALGGQAVLVGLVGKDDAGASLAALAADRGIVPAFVSEDRPTSRKIRALGGQQQLLRLDYEDDRPATGAAHDAALALVERHLPGAAVVVVSDYAKGLVNTAFCQQVLTLARQAAVPVVIDPRPQHAASYVGCDYLTPNWKEAQALLGDVDAAPTGPAVDDVGRRLTAKFGANVLLTLGAHGLKFFARDGGRVFDEPAQAREVFDVSGAGDTVVAAFALALAAGADVQTSLRLANRAAGVVVAKIGTATVSRAELATSPEADDRLVDRHVLIDRVRLARAAGRRIAVVTGPFDAIDRESLEPLRQARRSADLVIVGLPPGGDDVAARVPALLALRDVDLVCVMDQDVATAIEPDVRIDVRSASEAGRSR